MIAEKIANLQLKESLATVKNHLYNDQVCR